jgi:DNA invertase Pin-like site-specific DNA recombinase
MISSYTVTPL